MLELIHALYTLTGSDFDHVLERWHFNAEHVVFPVVDPTCGLIFEECVLRMLCIRVDGSSDSTRGSDEARKRVLGVRRDVGWVVGVDVNRSEISFLEVYEEMRNED